MDLILSAVFSERRGFNTIFYVYNLSGNAAFYA